MRKIPLYVCHVIPPHILRHIVEQPDVQARESARHTLELLAELGERGGPLQSEKDAEAAGKRRHVYDAAHRVILPGKLVMSEHKRRGTDRQVNEAYDGAGAFYDFFAKVYRRSSIDGRGGRIDSTVHYGVAFSNALWNGQQIIYGDGDGRYFQRFTAALDVIGHELTHGLTQHSARLGYRGQTGALNEHLADVFGTMLKQYVLGQKPRDASWLVGEGLFGPAVRGRAIRSMKAPGTAYDDPILGRDPQPWHMRDYVVTDADNGGVHINSGIPNHAFYRAAIELGSATWSILGHVWYATLVSPLPPDVTFLDFASLTAAKAGEMYGRGGAVQRSVVDAWNSVGLAVPAGRTNVTRPARPAERPAATPKWRTRPAVSSRTSRKEMP